MWSREICTNRPCQNNSYLPLVYPYILVTFLQLLLFFNLVYKHLDLAVTESSSYCLPHANKVLGQGIVTLFGKPADQEDGELVSQRAILLELELRLLLY